MTKKDDYDVTYALRNRISKAIRMHSRGMRHLRVRSSMTEHNIGEGRVDARRKKEERERERKKPGFLFRCSLLRTTECVGEIEKKKRRRSKPVDNMCPYSTTVRRLPGIVRVRQERRRVTSRKHAVMSLRYGLIGNREASSKWARAG